MLVQSSHNHLDRGLDPYFTPPEATEALLAIETIPQVIWEPACGDGAIAKVLRNAGRTVHCSDIADYGLPNTCLLDYLCAIPISCDGIITNPPFKLALAFAQKALKETSYLALLLRTNFLESTSRLSFFKSFPPSTVWISSRRLPMMHRLGWTGPEAPSNTCHAWFIWRQPLSGASQIQWFDWMDYQSTSIPTLDFDPDSIGM